MSIIIGVTGGIGSGKSTAAKLLSEKLSAPVLDADKIAKEAMKSSEIIQKIKIFFGAAIFDNPQIINSTRLANIVFSNEEKLVQLNNIVHPYVMEQMLNLIAELSTSNSYIILDVPLPNDSFVNMCNKILTITADYEMRIKRVMLRSSLSREAVITRISKQMSQEQYSKLADFTINNSSTFENLSLAIDKFILQII